METNATQPGAADLTSQRPGTVVEEYEQPRYSRRDTVLTMVGVLIVMLLASLDQTIVSTAMPRVIADLQGFDRYTWVSTAYLLTSTVMVPIYGKLSDLFGRKPIFLFGVVVFLIGSALSGASQSMNELIAFRAFQGIGAGALMPIAIAIVGDLFTPRERGKWQGLTGGVWGLSAMVTMIFGMGLFGSIFFIPLFVQGVIGTSATNSGLILTPLLLTSVVGSVVSGQLVSRLGRYKWIAILGMVVSVAGTLLLVRLDVNATNNDVLLAMLVLGLGLGFGMALYTLIVQNALPTKIGQATAALTFFRQIGGTIALAAMGSVMTSAYLPAFQKALPAAVHRLIPASALAVFHNPQVLLSPGLLAQMQAQFAAQGPQTLALFRQVIEAVKIGLAQGIHNVFILSFGLMIAGLIAVLFLKEIPLRGGRTAEKAATGEEVPQAESSLATIV